MPGKLANFPTIRQTGHQHASVTIASNHDEKKSEENTG